MARKMVWKAVNRSKVFGETFILIYSVIWISFLAVVVIWKWYEQFSPNDYILVGLGIAIPCFVGPLVFPDMKERRIPFSERYIVKANIFIFIVGYIGNHFYTHYFYDMLGMRYTGPLATGKGIEINQVPLSMFLFTHPYFMTYHVLAAPLLRATKVYLQKYPSPDILLGIFITLIAFMTAFIETWTISGFPYYTYPDFYTMLTKGSAFYGVFFVVTFPWFFRLDEDPRDLWSLGRVVKEALAAMMVVLICADFMRLFISKIGH